MRSHFATVRTSLLLLTVVLAVSPPLHSGPLTADAAPDTTAIDLETKNEKVIEAIGEFRNGRDAQALRLLEQATESEPTLPPAKVMLARLCLVAGRLPEGRKLLEEVSQALPGNPDVYALFGNIALAEGRATDALLHFERLQSIAADPSLAPELTKKFQIRALAGLAAVAEVRRDWRAAESALREWLKSEETGSAHNRLARARCLQGEVADALAELKVAFDLEPKLDPPETALGWLLSEAGDLVQAESRLKSATVEYADDSRSWFGLANWLLGQERPDDAHEAIQQARTLDPESPRIRFLAAIIARMQGDFAAAIDLLEPLVAKGPPEFGPTNQLALILAAHPERDQRVRALRLAEDNLRQHGAGSEALATLGWVHLKGGRYREAGQALNQAVAGGMLSPEAAYYLARLNLEQGERAEAVRLLTAAAAAPIGQFFSRREALRLLEELRSDAPAAPEDATERPVDDPRQPAEPLKKASPAKPSSLNRSANRGEAGKKPAGGGKAKKE